jgi:hypothetical protein
MAAPAARVDFRVAPVGLDSALVPDREDSVGYDRRNVAPHAAHFGSNPAEQFFASASTIL